MVGSRGWSCVGEGGGGGVKGKWKGGDGGVEWEIER